MISVIIPLYNKAPYIASTLQCVLQQTYTHYEIVVVDDGSTDDGVTKVKSVKDDRIRIVQQKNGGVSAARNRGIAEACGEYVAFLDADDEWRPDYLQTQMDLVLKYPQCDVFASNYEFRNVEGKVTNTIINKLPFEGTDGVLDNYFEVASCSHPPLWTSAVMVRKAAIQSIGGFPVGIKSGEDLLTWARLAVKYQIAYATASLAVFVFDERAFNEDQRNRMPEQTDFVGEELAKLQASYPNVQGLKQYVGVWHKMRARIFLSKHYRWKALHECCQSIRYALTVKIIVLMLLAFMPFSFVDFVFKKIR